MGKPTRTKRRGSFDNILSAPAQSPNDVIAQSHDHVMLDDAQVPMPEPEPVPVTRPQPAAASRPEPATASRGTGRAAKGTRPGDVHRSLYAKAETLELIRRIAFESNTSAQALYREGLLMMLQARGYAQDKTADDM